MQNGIKGTQKYAKGMHKNGKRVKRMHKDGKRIKRMEIGCKKDTKDVKIGLKKAQKE
jgi:hypothetical protein